MSNEQKLPDFHNVPKQTNFTMTKMQRNNMKISEKCCLSLYFLLSYLSIYLSSCYCSSSLLPLSFRFLHSLSLSFPPSLSSLPSSLPPSSIFLPFPPSLPFLSPSISSFPSSLPPFSFLLPRDHSSMPRCLG